MGNAIPLWGLFRFLKAVEKRGFSGDIEFFVGGGKVSMGFYNGRVCSITSDLPELSFKSFITKAKLVSDKSIAQAEQIMKSRGIGYLDALIEAKVIYPEFGLKLLTAYYRSVLATLFTTDIENYTMKPHQSWQGKQSLDITPELMRAVAKFQNIGMIREIVTKNLLSGPIRLVSGTEQYLADAKVIFGDSPILYIVRQGKLNELTEDCLDQELNIRVLFALFVCGALEVSKGSIEENKGSRIESEVMREIRVTANNFKNSNYYQILELRYDARISHILASYARIKRRFAESKFEGVVSPEVTPMLMMIRKKIDEAKATLTDRQARLNYNKSIGIGSKEIEEKTCMIFDALAYWSLGKDLFKERNYARAMEMFEQAMLRDKEEDLFLIWYARAKAANTQDPQEWEKSKQVVEQCLSRQFETVDAHIALSHILKLMGQLEKAEEVIKVALKLDPENEDAKTLKRVLQALPKDGKITFERKRETLLDKMKKLWNQ